MSTKKKVIILVGMVALLVLTGCLNFFLNKKTNDANANTGNVTNASFFDATRTSNQKTRNEAIAVYDSIIADASASDEAVAQAEKAKQALVEAMTMESNIEALIKALGFEDCIVSLTSENVNVIIKSDEMTSAEVAQVLQIITTETDKKASDVRIIPVE